MNKAPYMSKNEIEDYLRLGAIADAADVIAKHTPIKDWSQKLKTIKTYCNNIGNERLNYLDEKELLKVEHRVENSEILIYEKNEAKMVERRLSTKGKTMTVDFDAWFLLLKVVDNYVCRNCAQGSQVKNCEIRELLHKSMAWAYQDDPAEGECEFHWDSDKYDIDIQLKEKVNG